MVNAVVPLRHVRHETAVKVSVSQEGDLLLKGGTKSQLQSPAESKLAHRNRNLQENQEGSEDDDRGHRSESLTRNAELRGQVEKRPVQERFDEETGRRQEECGKKRQRGEQAVGSQ
jgi:hypothetical protein